MIAATVYGLVSLLIIVVGMAMSFPARIQELSNGQMLILLGLLGAMAAFWFELMARS